MTTVNKTKSAAAYIFTCIAFVLAVAIVFLFSRGKNATQAQVIASEPSFGSSNYNVMKQDTFVSLVRKAYGTLATVSNEDDVLYIDIKNANQLARDFFNSNDSLLEYDLGDYGFEIEYKQETQSVRAAFKVTAQQGVNVPNDILVKLIDKTYKN